MIRIRFHCLTHINDFTTELCVFYRQCNIPRMITPRVQKGGMVTFSIGPWSELGSGKPNSDQFWSVLEIPIQTKHDGDFRPRLIFEGRTKVWKTLLLVFTSVILKTTKLEVWNLIRNRFAPIHHPPATRPHDFGHLTTHGVVADRVVTHLVVTTRERIVISLSGAWSKNKHSFTLKILSFKATNKKRPFSITRHWGTL